MKFVIPKFGDRIRLVLDWTAEIEEGGRTNNTFLHGYCGLDAKLLRPSLWSPHSGDGFHRHTFAAGTVFVVQKIKVGRPYGNEVAEDAVEVFLKVVRVNGRGTSPPFRLRGGTFAEAEFEFEPPVPTSNQKALTMLLSGEEVQVSAARLAPGTGANGTMFLYPRRGESWNELRSKPYLALGRGGKVQVGSIMPDKKGSAWGLGTICIRPYGSQRTYGYRVKEADVVGWATDSLLQALAVAGTTHDTKE